MGSSPQTGLAPGSAHVVDTTTLENVAATFQSACLDRQIRQYSPAAVP